MNKVIIQQILDRLNLNLKQLNATLTECENNFSKHSNWIDKYDYFLPHKVQLELEISEIEKLLK